MATCGPSPPGMHRQALRAGLLVVALSCLAGSLAHRRQPAGAGGAANLLRLRGGTTPAGNKRFRFDAAVGAGGKRQASKARGASASAKASEKEMAKGKGEEKEKEKEKEEPKGSAGGEQQAKQLPSKEALFQLTTQLFSPQNTGTRKQNLFKVLGIDKTATTKQVRDAYYREARKWHPDKNKHDPQAEARFKLISEAYEVLSNPAKRKAYEEGGREGLDAQEAADNIDVKAVVRALFGGGEFDDIIGDAGEIPLLRRMVEKAGEMDDEDEDEDQDLDKLSEEEAKAKMEKMKAKEEKEREAEEEIEKEEKEQIRMVGEKLLARLVGRALGRVSDEAFATECRDWADHLCRAPGGLDLVKMSSKAWRQKGKLYAKRLWGLESIWTRIRGAFGTLSEGTGLLMGAMKATRMTRDALVKGKEAKNATEAMQDEDEAAEKKGTGVGSLEDEEEDEAKKDEDEMDIDKESMLKIAKVSLDVVWRFGIFLLQGRVRHSADSMFAQFRNSSDYTKAAEKDLALTLIEMAGHFRDVHDAAIASNSTDMRAGIPIHLDEMEEQMAAAADQMADDGEA